MNSTFSMYAARISGLHNLHPFTKGVLALSLLVTGFALPGNWSSYLLLAFIILPVALWGKVFQDLCRTTLRVSWPFIISVLLIQSLFWGKGTPLFELGWIVPKKEGVTFAFISIGRILLTMTTFILFALTTRPDFLMISLKQGGAPSSLAYIVVTTLQIIPRFQSKASTILDAQRSRGLETEGNIITRARAVVPLILPLVLGSLVEVEERAIAIEARAFNSNRKETSLIEIPDSQSQKIIRIGMIVFALSAIVVRILWR